MQEIFFMASFASHFLTNYNVDPKRIFLMFTQMSSQKLLIITKYVFLAFALADKYFLEIFL